VEISGDTSDIIFMQVMKSLVNNDLKTREVGLSADDTIQISGACSEMVKKMRELKLSPNYT
jgi:hypothetical protein